MKSTKLSVSGRSVVSAFESLESRVLFASNPSVTTILADNRGEATITVNEALKPQTVNTQSVLLYTAASGDSNNNPADPSHILKTAIVTYDKTTKQIVIHTKHNLPANTPYEVIVKGRLVTSKAGTGSLPLDGGNPTTTGAAGAQFKFVTSVDSTNIAIFQTSLGTMDVQLQPESSMPLTITNFLSYVNSGAYDGSFFHRLTTLGNSGIGVLQGGGFNVSGNTIGTIATNASIDLERGISNVAGTIAMARTSAPNTATDEFYFNYTDDTALNEPAGSGAPTSGYAAFGTVVSAQDMDVLQALSGVSTVDLSSFAGGNPSSPYNALNTLPVLNSSATAAQVNSNLAANLVFINRVALESSVSAAAPSASPME